MTQIAEEAGGESGLSGFWEALRTVSGLVAVAAVGLIVLATTVLGRDDAPARRVLATESPPAIPAPAAEQEVYLVSSRSPTQRVFVFYLVSTAEQADAADWGEQVGQNELPSLASGLADRSYEILFARDESEIEAAGTAILTRMLSHGREARVQVIDMRR